MMICSDEKKLWGGGSLFRLINIKKHFYPQSYLGMRCDIMDSSLRNREKGKEGGEIGEKGMQGWRREEEGRREKWVSTKMELGLLVDLEGL